MGALAKDRRAIYFCGYGERASKDQLFHALSTDGQIVAVSINDCRSGAPRTDGLVEGHSFSVLGAASVRTVEGQTHQLVCLRNPWGSDCEWNGPWSDGSPDWTDKVEQELFAKTRLGRSNKSTGIFWMSFDDLCCIFTTVYICKISVSSPNGTRTARIAEAQ